jgi:hypothetical protein
LVDASTVPGYFVLDGRDPPGALGKATPVADNNVFGQAEAAQAAVGPHGFAVDGFAIVGHDNAKIDVALPLDGSPFGLGAEEVDLLRRKLVLETADNFLGLLSVQNHSDSIHCAISGSKTKCGTPQEGGKPESGEREGAGGRDV